MSHPDTKWMKYATCEDMGNQRFFSENPQRKNVALFVCSLCPVKKPCLKYAMKFPEMRGIWGGLTYEERKELRQQMKQRREEKKRLQFIYDEESA